MSRVKAPALSLDASGTIGSRLTYQSRQRIHRAIETPRPPPPNSPLQQQHQSLYTNAVSFWRTFLTTSPHKDAWDRSASIRRTKGRGYQLAVSNFIQAQRAVTPSSAVTLLQPFTGRTSVVYTHDLRTQAYGTQATPFVLWAGTSPHQLTPFADYTQSGHRLVTGALGPAGQVTYLQLIGNGLPISGLYRITLAEAPTVPLTTFDDILITGDAELQGTPTGWPGFVHRGYPADFDFVKADFTTDQNWHSLDFSAIIPPGTTLVCCRLQLTAAAPNSYLFFKAHGVASSRSRSATQTQVANVAVFSDIAFECDADRLVDYYARNIAWVGIDMTVYGWFL